MIGLSLSNDKNIFFPRYILYIHIFLSVNNFFVTLYLSAFKTLFSIHIKTDIYLWYTHPAWCLSYQTDCLVITQLMMTLLSFASQHFLSFVYFHHFDQIRKFQLLIYLSFRYKLSLTRYLLIKSDVLFICSFMYIAQVYIPS